jgi:hypothetical protein
MLFEMNNQKTAPTTPAALQSAEKQAKDIASLDDAILNFFGANDKK